MSVHLDYHQPRAETSANAKPPDADGSTFVVDGGQSAHHLAWESRQT